MREFRSIAGIVAFNPDERRINENISAIYHQVSEVVVVDNNSKSKDYIERIENKYPNISFIVNSENYGIAKALNQILSYAQMHNFEWVLSLDQDSVVAGDLINKYDEFLRQYNSDGKIAMVTCLRQDRNYDTKAVHTNTFNRVDRCITSASYANVDIMCACGMYDENMFIDYVDFDVCATLTENGYSIIRLNIVGFLHELGNSKRVRFLNKNPIVYNESAFRKYYLFRNILYYMHKHDGVIDRKAECKELLKTFLFTILFEEDKINKVSAMTKGIIDSRKIVKTYDKAREEHN